jgi:hypothetical protein
MAGIERLEPLIGEWRVSADFPGQSPTDLTGRLVCEWMLGGQYLAMRSEAPDPVPDSFSIIAADGERFTQHYYDSRGVKRLYTMEFGDGRWTLLRTEPDFSPLPFHQRYVGDVGADEVRGRWEKSDDGREWELDFHLLYTRVA